MNILNITELPPLPEATTPDVLKTLPMKPPMKKKVEDEDDEE